MQVIDAKAILVEETCGDNIYSLTGVGGISISLKTNLMAWIEFEHVYFAFAVQHVGY